MSVPISAEVVGDVGVIRVQGDFDTLEAPRFVEVATGVLSDGARSLVIDCEAITFIGSTGLSALIDAHKRAELQFGTVTLRNPTAFMVRILEITGLDDVLLVEAAAVTNHE
jgi:anti-sigma B factor antagonist